MLLARKGGEIRTAPSPAKLIPKGLFAVSLWVEVLLKKFEFKKPLPRMVHEDASAAGWCD